MVKVLITGSDGYLGSVMGRFLMQSGCECTGIDTGFFKDCFLYKEVDSMKKISKDVRTLKKEDLKEFDVLVHLAGISNDPMDKLSEGTVYDPTREYSKMLALYCKQIGIKFIFASSCSVYGIGQNSLLNENSEVNPQTGYSRNKYQIEADLRDLSSEDFRPIALRFATVFGLSPRMRFDIVANMFAGMAFTTKEIILNSDGEAWRPLLHITDLCEAVRRAIIEDIKHTGLLILNVGDDENNYRVIDIAKKACESVEGSKIKYLSENPKLDVLGLIRDRKVKDNDTRTYRVSFKKITEYFPGFKCSISLKEGMREMMDKFEEINLNSRVFNSKSFYRLQMLEMHIKNDTLDKELLWKNDIKQP